MQERSDFYVYAHTRGDDGYIFYIGKGCRRRAWSSNGRNDEWKSIVQSVGFNVLILHDGLTQEQAFAIEIDEILKVSEKVTLANRTKGGSGGTSQGYKHSDEIRAIISAAQKGRKKSDEHKEKLRMANIGKKLSKDTRRKMSEIRRSKGTNHLEGKLKSDSHKEKISKSVTGKKKSTNKSGYVGVYYHKSAEKWAASITKNGKAKHLGLFETPEKASKAYQLAKSKILNEGEKHDGD
jgi:hypothetical protein